VTESFDVVVVGGGVNGTGIARDLALRGVKTALFEKRDLSSGATGGCSGMIHGGLRYLIYNLKVTEHSCVDSGYIQKLAPHLLFRIPFIMPLPTRPPATSSRPTSRFTTSSAHEARQALHMLTAEQTRALVPAISPDVVGAVTTDEWGIDPSASASPTPSPPPSTRHHPHPRRGDRVSKGPLGPVIGVKVRDRFGHLGEVEAASSCTPPGRGSRAPRSWPASTSRSGRARECISPSTAGSST